mmetsp:Transcript_117345/g.163302  ORF Transcript_117345/g.163302 Transcript_117345/m.163302 type:complete len:340 (-) Transcript_117345:186-1205(-)
MAAPGEGLGKVYQHALGNYRSHAKRRGFGSFAQGLCLSYRVSRCCATHFAKPAARETSQSALSLQLLCLESRLVLHLGLDVIDLLQGGLDCEEHARERPGDSPAPALVVVVVLLAVEADALVTERARFIRVVVAREDAKEREPDAHERQDGRLLELAVDAQAEHPGQDEAEEEPAGLAHHQDTLVRDVELRPIADEGEGAEQQGGVVRRLGLLERLPAEQQADEDQDGSVGALWDHLVNGREEAGDQQDEVQDAVDEAVAAPGAQRLVDGVADVDRRGEEAAEERTEARSCAIDEHGLRHRVVVPGRRCALHAGHRGREADHRDEEQGRDHVTDLPEAP